jgi:crotonobetainyl-CoA:carnitine CoA-transferase CaiB-like acyl-CoA transferase
MPYGLALAASLGARVVKVEGLRGDPWRMLQGPEPEVFSAQCLQGKESVALDLEVPEAREVLLRLVARADAFVYSLRPSPVELGLADADLRPLNPGLVYVERPGYGTSGPYAGRPMYAHTADAVSGMYMRDGEYWLTPQRCHGAAVFELKAIQVERMVTDRMYADGHGANAVFSIVLMALLAKRRWGLGQHVSSSMLHAALLGVADEFVDYAGVPAFPRSDPEQLGLGARYRLYRAADGWVFLAAPTPRSWAACCTVLGRPDLRDDPRADAEPGSEADDALAVELGHALVARPAPEWERVLSDAGVGCAAVGRWPLQGFTSLDEGLRASGLTVEVEQPTLGPLVRPAAAARCSLTPPPVAPGTVHGQDTEAVLRELGYDDAAIGDLVARGVVFVRR